MRRLAFTLTAVLMAASACGTTDEDVAVAEVPTLHPTVDTFPAATVELRGPDGQREAVAARLALTADQRRHGLMEVTSLPDATGMLFVYDEPRELGYWMKNTLVPLDLAAITADGEISDIMPMEPCPPDTDCPTYRPEGSAVAGLETSQGWLDEVGVEAGWTLCVRGEGAPSALACATTE